MEVEEAVGSERALLAVAQQDAQLGGQEVLSGGEVLRVGAELDQEVGFGRAGELGVEWLVGPGAEAARRVDAGEEIGVAVPNAVVEPALVNERLAGLHGAAGFEACVGLADADHRAVAGFERLQDLSFVIEALLADQSHFGVVGVGLGEAGVLAALGVGAFHPGGEFALEESDEVGGGESYAAIGIKLHNTTVVLRCDRTVKALAPCR